jgi:hypothetical protein
MMRADAQYVPTAPLSPEGAQDLARRVAATLAGARADGLAAALASGVRDAACYEASVRLCAGSHPTAGRMMIERASPAIVQEIARLLGIALLPEAIRWLDLAVRQGLLVIAGWACRGGGAQPCVKLYVNASEASVGARARLLAVFAPNLTAGTEPPAVMGMNARADGVVETKLYVQSADTVALAERVGARALALAHAAHSEGADAGGVLSFDVEDGRALCARAFFVALREPANGDWQCVRSVPGYDREHFASLLPFSPAPPRSIGIALSGEETWTLYCKPRHSGRAPEAVEPAAIFCVGDAEVGVFLEPTEHAARTFSRFSRTERHAVSVRILAGAPIPRDLESLVEWVTAALRGAERDNALITERLCHPPRPWRLAPAAPYYGTEAQA